MGVFQTKISLGSFFIIIVAILMIIAVIFSGLYVAKNVKPPQNFGSMANAIDEQQGEISNNNIENNEKISATIDNSKSIILNGWVDYNAKEGYGAERKYITGKENGLLKYTDANNYKNKNYYLYIKNKYLGETTLEPVEGPYDGIMILNYLNISQEEYNEKDSITFNILIDSKYDAIPRKSEKAELTDKMRLNISKLYEYSDYEVEKVDLDGDGKFEYFVALQDKLNKQIGKSQLIMFNEEEKIADLVSITNGYWARNYDNGAVPTQVNLTYLTYIDLDNDGIMEILTILPTWEGEPEYTVFKYENGKIIGSTVEMDLTEYP